MNQEGAKLHRRKWLCALYRTRKMPFYPKKERFVSKKSKILQMNDKYLNLFCYICTK